jgi:lipopolysaccharide transport system permease protein
MPERGYTSSNIAALPFAQPMAFAKLTYVRDLLRELVRRDTKVRYEGTLLGVLWLLAKPLLTVGVLFFTFHLVLAINVPRFTSFALIGVLVYTWFQSSLLDASSIGLANRDLVRRPQFTIAILPLVAVMTNFVHFLFAVPVLAVVLLIGGSDPSIALFALPGVMAIQFVATTGLAYIVAAAGVLYRDIGHLVGVGLTLFFFLSPVFYDPTQVPPEYQPLYRLNPLVALLDAYRALLLRGETPEWSGLAIVAAVGTLLALIGALLFKKVSHRFVEEL